MRASWQEYTGPDDRASSELALAFLEGRIPYSEYSWRQRELSHGIAGSTLYVLFMATILPAVDWVQAMLRTLRRILRGVHRRHLIIISIVGVGVMLGVILCYLSPLPSIVIPY